MTDGERVERMICAWIERATAIDWIGTDRPTVDISGAPLEIKMIYAFDTIEYNISNGGWRQFLWNCISDWRGLIDVARDGYRLIGAPEQCAALDWLLASCTAQERECVALQRRAEEERALDNHLFAEFTGGPGFDWERLFWSESGVYDQRLVWLAANERRVRKALRYPLPERTR